MMSIPADQARTETPQAKKGRVLSYINLACLAVLGGLNVQMWRGIGEMNGIISKARVESFNRCAVPADSYNDNFYEDKQVKTKITRDYKRGVFATTDKITVTTTDKEGAILITEFQSRSGAVTTEKRYPKVSKLAIEQQAYNINIAKGCISLETR